MVSSGYRRIEGACTSHQISNEVIENLLLEKIQNILAYISQHESTFVQLVSSLITDEMNRSLRDGKRELNQASAWMQKLDTIIQKLYEDNLDGNISDERFAKMTVSYEQEQNDLWERIA